jgi:hypothetical membrane protein
MSNLYFAIKNSLIKFGSKKYLLSTLIVFTLGFVMAAIMTKDKNWWQGSTCSLGMKVNGTPEFYNYTFIIVGLMLILFSLVINPQINKLLRDSVITRLKMNLLKIFYFIEMITLIAVGAIPYGNADNTNTIHIWLGFYVFINAGIVMLFAFWFFNKFSKKFLNANYIILIIALLSYFLGIGAKMLPYAIAEMITIVLVLGWMGMTFIRIDELSKK